MGAQEWSQGLADGVMVELNIRRYRPHTKSTLIRPEYDARMKTIETKARNNLRTHSFSCDMFGTHGKFVPIGAYLDFRERNEALQRDFQKTKEQAIKAYADDLKANSKTKDAISIDEMRRSYDYVTVIRQVPSNIMLAASGCSDDRVVSVSSMAPPSVCLGESTVEEARTMLTSDLMTSVNEHTNIVTTAFMRESSIRLRELVIDAGGRIVDSIDRNGKLVGRASIMAHNMIESVRALDYYGDRDMQMAMDAIDGELQGDRDVQALRRSIDMTVRWAGRSVSYLKGLTDEYPQPVMRKETPSEESSRKPRDARQAKERDVIVIPSAKKKRHVNVR